MLDTYYLFQNHLEQKDLIQALVQGNTGVKEKIQTSCYEDCVLAKWLHTDANRNRNALHQIDSVCNHCERFQEVANEIVLLSHRGQTDKAVILQKGQLYAETSARFLAKLVDLHG
jgi:hypothetical protein